MKKNLLVLLFFLAQIYCHAQESFYKQLADSSFVLTKQRVVYDPSYFSIKYPMGDVPEGKGVCTDVVIRAYRMFGIDLQKEIHEDMKKNFSAYPQNWRLSRPDRNIDHRRVPNLMFYFSCFGDELVVSNKAADYKPGDIVCWDLGKGITHIGIVSNIKSKVGNHYQIIHNIGQGQVLEDMLFHFKIIGHYRFNDTER